jgi:hypothetical protein
MPLRELSAEHLSTLDWRDAGQGWVQIVADVTCAGCGGYQAADCDPTNDRAAAVRLALRLFNHVGWRVDPGHRLLCPECAETGESE